LDEHDRHVAVDWAKVALGMGVLLLGVCALFFCIYLVIAPVKAIPFDADGVRCYSRALQTTCLQVVPHP
jgi:hypothetical protein